MPGPGSSPTVDKCRFTRNVRALNVSSGPNGLMIQRAAVGCPRHRDAALAALSCYLVNEAHVGISDEPRVPLLRRR